MKNYMVIWYAIYQNEGPDIYKISWYKILNDMLQINLFEDDEIFNIPLHNIKKYINTKNVEKYKTPLKVLSPIPDKLNLS